MGHDKKKIFSLILVFTIIHTDDPLEPNRRAIKTKTMRLTDPTKLDSQKAEEEGSILNGTKSFQKLGKDTLNVDSCRRHVLPIHGPAQDRSTMLSLVPKS